jgi:hypothetical protein
MMDTKEQNASMKMLTKVASHDASAAFLIRQAALNKTADGDFTSKINDYATRFGNWFMNDGGWKDMLIGGGTALTVGGLTHALQGKKKKNPVIPILAGLTAGGAATYFGKDIRNFASEQWNKWFPKKQNTNPPATTETTTQDGGTTTDDKREEGAGK